MTDNPQHTCINTATTSDGQPPPPCQACLADPAKFPKLPVGQAPDSTGIDVTRRNLVLRALEFSAHGHGELPAGFMSDAVNCLTGVLRDTENQLLERLAVAQAALDSLRREHLRVSRLRAGLSLRPAAELLGLEPKRLGDIEHGRAHASDEEWQSIFSRLTDAGNTGKA